jgi:hypothetical protein
VYAFSILWFKEFQGLGLGFTILGLKGVRVRFKVLGVCF